jgi:hypothetical protein
MILNYCTLKGDMLEFGFSEGKTCVDIRMPYAKFSESITPGTLHEQCEAYIGQMVELATLLS